jgi:hypothetical protein
MKVEYDSETDTPTVILRAGAVAESDEDKPGVIPLPLSWHTAGTQNTALRGAPDADGRL